MYCISFYIFLAWSFEEGGQSREDPVDVWYLALGHTKQTGIPDDENLDFPGGKSKFSSSESMRRFLKCALHGIAKSGGSARSARPALGGLTDKTFCRCNVNCSNNRALMYFPK